MNVVTALGYSKIPGAVDVTESLVALVTQTRAVQGGNLAGLEATLTAQVTREPLSECGTRVQARIGRDLVQRYSHRRAAP